jgi:hypothetical protein
LVDHLAPRQLTLQAMVVLAEEIIIPEQVLNLEVEAGLAHIPATQTHLVEEVLDMVAVAVEWVALWA